MQMKQNLAEKKSVLHGLVPKKGKTVTKKMTSNVLFLWEFNFSASKKYAH